MEQKIKWLVFYPMLMIVSGIINLISAFSAFLSLNIIAGAITGIIIYFKFRIGFALLQSNSAKSYKENLVYLKLVPLIQAFFLFINTYSTLKTMSFLVSIVYGVIVYFVWTRTDIEYFEKRKELFNEE